MDDCVFCGIIAGTEPATFVRTWRDAVAFVPFNPVTPGHALVVPREHERDATESDDVTTIAVVRALELARNMSASNILINNGEAATQSVFHIHVHVIPRTSGDQLMVPWGTTGDPHAPHRCVGMDRLEAELLRAREGPARADSFACDAAVILGDLRRREFPGQPTGTVAITSADE